MRKYDVLVGLFSLGFGLLILFLSRDMSMFDEYGVPGERYWPFGLACLFILLGVLQWGVVLKNRLMADRSIDFSSVNVRKAYLIGALAVGYGIVMAWAGFIISAVIFIPCTMVLMKEKRVGFVTLSTLLIVTAVYLFFTYLFNTPLPTAEFSDLGF